MKWCITSILKIFYAWPIFFACVKNPVNICNSSMKECFASTLKVVNLLISHPSLVKELHFSVVVFDTAPTGHTLRFLAMPTLFQKGLGKMTQLKSQFGPIFSSVSGPCWLSVVAVVV